MPDIGDEKVVNDQRSQAGRRESDRKVIWDALYQRKEGRDFMWWLLEQGNIFTSSFRGPDTHLMAFNEGKRALMLPILSEMIRANPEGYNRMVREHAAINMETENG